MYDEQKSNNGYQRVFFGVPHIRNFIMFSKTTKTEDEYFLKPPSQQLFYNIMAFLLSIFSLNNDFWAFYKMPDHILCHLQKRITQVSLYFAFLSQILYLMMNYSELDFNTLAVIYTVVPVTFVLVVKISIAQTSLYKKAMMEYMEQIHIYTYYRNNKQPHVKEILIKAETYTRWSIYTLAILVTVCTSCFFVVPIIHNFHNNDSIYNITTRLEIMVHFWVPVDYEFNIYYWAVMQVATLYCVVIAVSIIVLFDMMYLSFLYHLTGHVKILKHILREEFKGKLTQEEMKFKLIRVTRYYAFVRRIFKDVEDAFGVNIIGIYLHNLFGGGLLIYQIMTSGTNTEILLSYGLMIPIYMGELIIMSFVMENIRIQADEIPELVYNLRWEKMSLTNQKLVLMILFQVQPVLEIRAAFGARTGVKSAISILKTTFSYYVMIKSRM